MKVLALIAIALVGYTAAYQVCKGPVDVVLVVEDSSFLLDTTNAGNLQTFLSNIVNYFQLGSGSGQVAYFQYSAAGNSDVFFLKDFTVTSDAKAAILKRPFHLQGDAPLIANALNYTWATHLSVNNGERSCYPTVIILVSYSGPPPPDGPGDGREFLKQEAEDLTAVRQLKNSDALVITVGIGENRNPTLLLELATNGSSSTEYYFDFKDFDALTLTEDRAKDIAALACNYAANGVFYPCEMETVSADFTFVVDRNKALNVSTTGEWILTFIENYLTPYHWGPYQWGPDLIEAGIQASFLTYSKTGDVQVNFGDAKTLDDFINQARKALGDGCQGDCTSTCVHDALDKINNHVLNPSNKPYRNNCTLHYVFIFTSGCFNCPEDPIPYANDIRKGDAEIFVVPLQPSPTFGFWKEPLEIADDASHLYEAQADPQSILTNYLHKQAWRQVCVNRGNAFCARFPAPTPTPTPFNMTDF